MKNPAEAKLFVHPKQTVIHKHNRINQPPHQSDTQLLISSSGSIPLAQVDVLLGRPQQKIPLISASVLGGQGQICPPSVVHQPERLYSRFKGRVASSHFQGGVLLIIISLAERIVMWQTVGLLPLNQSNRLEV